MCIVQYHVERKKISYKLFPLFLKWLTEAHAYNYITRPVFKSNFYILFFIFVMWYVFFLFRFFSVFVICKYEKIVRWIILFLKNYVETLSGLNVFLFFFLFDKMYYVKVTQKKKTIASQRSQAECKKKSVSFECGLLAGANTCTYAV